LKSRTDVLQPQNKTERFRHDVLDRLTCAYFSPTENANAACDTSYGYAANGNLTTKSDVGALSYTDPKHPHAVVNAGGSVYAYDAVGNQVMRPGGVGIIYTAFDLPKTITQGAKIVSFGYDGDEQRIRKTTSTSEALYFGDIFEQVTTGAVKEFRYYVQSPERTIAIVTHGGNEPGIKFINVDHLGSTETTTNELGVQVEKRSFDAFGARRNPQWGAPGGAFPSKTKKGFTGHDEEDEFGLVNMKGRLYDPKIARFTTTDPVIADVFDGQSFAAYSYVRNNPLTLIDPSGFDPEKQPIFPIAERITTNADGSITLDLLGPPREGQPQKTLPPVQDASKVGAAAPSVDTSTTGDGGDDLSQDTAEAEPIDFRENQVFQLGGSYLFGVAEGLVPFAGLGHSLGNAVGLIGERSNDVKFGLAIGQIVGGVIATMGGIGGEVLGGAASVTGVGAAIGVPVMVVSAVAVTGGIANIVAGIEGLASVMGGGGGTRGPPAGGAGSARGSQSATWTPGKQLWSKGKLGEHFTKHGAEVGASSSSEYSRMATEFGSAPNTGQFLDMKNGAFFYRYEPTTNRIFVGTTAGEQIKTFYRWDGRAIDAVITALKGAGQL
jgi:RHS repeat-associated protein